MVDIIVCCRLQLILLELYARFMLLTTQEKKYKFKMEVLKSLACVLDISNLRRWCLITQFKKNKKKYFFPIFNQQEKTMDTKTTKNLYVFTRLFFCQQCNFFCCSFVLKKTLSVKALKLNVENNQQFAMTNALYKMHETDLYLVVTYDEFM